MAMRLDFIALGLLFILGGLSIRMKVKFLSERIGVVGLLLTGTALVVAGLML